MINGHGGAWRSVSDVDVLESAVVRLVCLLRVLSRRALGLGPFMQRADVSDIVFPFGYELSRDVAS